MPLTELEQEFYATNVVQEEVEVAEQQEEQVEQTEEVVAEVAAETEQVAEQVQEEKVAVQQEVVQEQAELKPTKKYIPIEDEESIYKTLDQKYGHKKMKPEEKALAFIAQQNPGLDDDEIFFIAQSEFGIGVEKPSDEDLTDEQVLSLRKQEISRKKLMYQVDQYFEQRAKEVELHGHNPLDDDEGYKTYQTQAQKQAEQQKEYEATVSNLHTQIETNAKSISELKVPIEIDIDESKFAIEVNFKMDEAKQKEVMEYAKRYTPSDAEIAKFTDSSTGKFDFKGYLSDLAPRVFAKQINTVALRQALAADREKFIEKELKNSTLRNNDVSQVVDKAFDVVDAWPFGK